MVSGPSAGGAVSGDSIETLFVDIAARADRLVADAEMAVNQVVRNMQQIDKAAEQTGRVYTRLGGIIKQALTIAAGIGFYNMTQQIITRVMNLGKQMISTNAQMQMFQKSFEVLTGSAKEAGEIIDWVRDQAKKTPFDVPGLINASQMLMTWGLDLKEWFTVVGDVAAGMNRPITQVVNAIGTLATGQTGEAVRRFRDLGINLREFTDVLEFDAQGSLITPLEEAIPIVKQIMVDRFGGMMESQSKTWEGVMSNMADTWQQFVQVLGEPVFDLLNERLIQMGNWVDENADELEAFATNLGNAFGATLETVLDLLMVVGALIKELENLTHTLENIPTAVGTARKIVGIASVVPGGIQAGIGTLSDILSSAAGGDFDIEALNERAAGRLQVVRETMLAIAGWTDAEKEALEIEREITEEEYKAAMAVRALGGEYENMSVVHIANLASMAKMKGILGENREAIEKALGPFAFLTDEILEQDHQLGELVGTYENAITKERELAAAAKEAADELERQAQAFQEMMDIALEAAPGLTDTLRKAMDAMAEGIQSASAASTQAIDEIMAKAQEAEQAAILANQQAVAKLRADFDRDQLRRREQFNQRWERLIREQNDTNADIEWDYQYQRQQLLIEGDELALAELEARYEHEKESRDRDQGQARDDMQEEFNRQKAEQESAFQERVKALEDRLEEELAKVRQQAEDAAKAQQEKDEETREKQEQSATDLHERLGEMLYDQTQGNDEAARLILSAWGEMYTGIETDAIWTAYVMRRELMDTIALIMQARAEMERLRQEAGSGWIPPSEGPDPLGAPLYHQGGYTPGVNRMIGTQPGEFMASRATTRALESALGGRLTQESLQGLALSTTQRRFLDVNVKASGVPADVLGKMYRDLVTAMTEETGEY